MNTHVSLCCTCVSEWVWADTYGDRPKRATNRWWWSFHVVFAQILQRQTFMYISMRHTNEILITLRGKNADFARPNELLNFFLFPLIYFFRLTHIGSYRAIDTHTHYFQKELAEGRWFASIITNLFDIWLWQCVFFPIYYQDIWNSLGVFNTCFNFALNTFHLLNSKFCTIIMIAVRPLPENGKSWNEEVDIFNWNKLRCTKSSHLFLFVTNHFTSLRLVLFQMIFVPVFANACVFVCLYMISVKANKCTDINSTVADLDFQMKRKISILHLIALFGSILYRIF